MGINLSVVLIVKNEEGHLEECLKTVNWADEIIVYDSGSTDKTLEIAKRFTKKVFIDRKWEGFGVQRQKAQKKAVGEWIFMIDADERVTPQLRASIEEAIAGNQDTSYKVGRLTYSFGGYIRHGGWYPDYVERLYPAKKAHFNESLVHETVAHVEPMVIKKLAGDLIHYTYRDIEHYVNKSARYASLWAQTKYNNGKRTFILYGPIYALGHFIKIYLFKAGFLDGARGFLIAVLSGMSAYMKQASLWTLSKSKSGEHRKNQTND